MARVHLSCIGGWADQAHIYLAPAMGCRELRAQIGPYCFGQRKTIDFLGYNIYLITTYKNYFYIQFQTLNTHTIYISSLYQLCPTALYVIFHYREPTDLA